VSMGVDRELLTKCELDDGLVLATPEQAEDAAEDHDRERSRGPHRIGFCPRPGREGSLNLG